MALLQYYKFTQTVTPHIVLPDLDIGFNSRILPLLQLNNLELDYKCNHPLHFFYWEDVTIDYLRFKYNVSTSKKSDIEFLGINIENIAEFEDPVLINQLKDRGVEEKPFQYLEIINTEISNNIPKVPNPETQTDDFKHWEKIEKQKIYDVNLTMKDSYYFGPYPLSVQNGFYFPKDSKGNDMSFIGQIQAMDFELADFTYYLFYSPKLDEAVQLMQMT